MERRKQRRDEELHKRIILRIKELRFIHDNEPQEQLADGTGLSIGMLESGKNYPNLTSLALICEHYNITLDEFFAPLNYPPKK